MAACSSLQQLNAGNAHFSLFASIQLLQGGKYSNWFHEMPPPPPIPLFLRWLSTMCSIGPLHRSRVPLPPAAAEDVSGWNAGKGPVNM